MNKDEAIRCLDISKKKYKAGDAAGALKFAEKSVKLCETLDGTNWLSFVKANPTPNVSKRKHVPVPEENNAKEDSASRPYTQEQVQGIKRILEKKKDGDLYGIFGLEKGCTENDIKKAYRKHALLYHPDKCGAPGTDDAFKAIGHAWAVLGDADKRSNYDRFGIDSEASGSRGARSPGFSGFGGFNGQRTGFEGEISPEDLFRMFMGANGFGGSTFTFNAGPQFRRRQTHARQQQAEPAGNFAAFMQLLPVLLLFLLSFISMWTSEEESFSFRRTYEYSLEVKSVPHSVPYYVNPKTYKRRYNTKKKQAELDRNVEAEFLQHIRYKCGQERETQAYYIRQATGWFSTDQDKLTAAQNMNMPNCEKLADWYKTV